MEYTTVLPMAEGAPEPFDWTNETLVGNKSVAQLASEYTIYKIGFGLHIYWLPVIVLVGIIGNTLALLIMLKKNNRRLSCCLYMAALAVADNICLLIMGYYWTKPTFEIPIFHNLECSILGYILIASAQFGILIIVAMTVDRFIAVRFSLSSFRRAHCTPKRTMIMIGILVLFAMFFNIPHLVLLDSGVNYTCITFSGKSTWVRVYAILCIILNAFIPFVSLLVMNIIILKTIRSATKTFKDATEFSRIKGPSDKNKSKDSEDKEQAQLTVMLLLVNFVFLLLCMPVYVRYMVYTIVDYRTDPAVLATYILVYHITHKLYYTNNAVNFFLYCIGGSKFRKELRQLFVHIRDSVSSNSDKTHSTGSSSV